MSLIGQFEHECTVMSLKSTPDGLGGHTNVWTPGVLFVAAITRATASVRWLAEKPGADGVYTITTPSGTGLKFGDAVMRISDGATFKVTSNQPDAETPLCSSLNIGQVTAERCVLT